MTTSLVKSGHFNVLERAKLDAVKGELVLDNSGLVTPASAAKIGKLQGAQYLVTGAITEYSNKAGGGGIGVGGFTFGSKGGTATLGIDLRIIDVTTGEVAFAVTANGKSGSSGNAISYVDSKVSLGGKNYNNSALGKAVRNAMNDAVQKLCDQFEQIQSPTWKGEVVDVDMVGGKPDTIYVDGGSQAGLQEGDELEIVVQGKEIKNHEGEVLDHKPDRHIARCKIVSVKEKSATATLTEVGDFQKDDIATYIVKKVNAAKSGNDPAVKSDSDPPGKSSGPNIQDKQEDAGDKSGNDPKPKNRCAMPVRQKRRGIAAGGEKYAVLVGINDYGGAAPTLSYAVSDATRLYRTLTDARYGGLNKDHVALLSSDEKNDEKKPTRENILKAVQTMMHKAGPRDQFWFYFAGHGIQLHDYSYLVTQGFSLQDMDHTALSTHLLRTMLAKECKATQRLLILDACESGSTRSLRGIGGVEPEPALPTSSAETITLTACSVNESATEFSDFHDGTGGGGIFTYYLVHGLQGLADGNRDGLVSASEIRDYVKQAIARRMKQDAFVQTPQFIAQGRGEPTRTFLTRALTQDAATQESEEPKAGEIQTKKPLPPTLIVYLNQGANAGTGAENAVIEGLMKQGFLIADPQAAGVLHNLSGDQEMAKAASKRGAHFLVVGQVSSSTDSAVPPFVTVVTTISARVVDEQGNVMATARATSDPHAAASQERAQTDALNDVAEKFLDQLVTTTLKQALGIKS